MPFQPQRFIHAANVRLDVPVSVYLSEKLTDELRHQLEDATLLSSPTNKKLFEESGSHCAGSRRWGKPLMALTVKKNLGKVRHALSQMVVAGTMTVQKPVQVRITPPSAGDEESSG